jgi:hypothetical protein
MASSAQPQQVFTNKLYNALVFIAQIVLPALATLWFTVGGIWSLAHTTEVVGTITAVDLFLGAILKLASYQYYKNGANFDGSVGIVEDEEGTPKVKVDLARDLGEVIEDDPGKHSIEFRINRPPNSDS